MLRFSIALIFTSILFNCIFQGNTVETNPPTKNSDAPQESENTTKGAPSIPNVDEKQPPENTENKKDEGTENVQSSDQPTLSNSSEGIEDDDNHRDEEIIPDKVKRTDLSDTEKAAFTVIHEFNDEEDGSFEYVLPNISKFIEGKWTLSSINSEPTKETHLCPDISLPHDSEDLNPLYKANPATKSCLFTKAFELNELKTCTEEPIPWLTMQENPELYEDASIGINCNAPNQHLVVFEYNQCDPVEHFISHEKNDGHKKPKLPYLIKTKYPMYEICYDFYYLKTIWTRHHVLEPMLIYDSTIPSINEDHIDLNTLSISTFDLPSLKPKTFINLKNKYQNKKVDMKAEFLVPMQHMAMQNWKKSTKHFINTAPLREKFHQLLHIIDQGLIKASYYKFINTGKPLQIFTAAETKTGIRKIFKDNIWYKFVYDEVTMSGALVYLKNVLESPAELPCENSLHCHFNKWVKPEGDIPEDILKYAGCCGVNAQRLKELFQIDVFAEEIPIMDLNMMIIYAADITDTRLRFLEKRDASMAGNDQLIEDDLQEDYIQLDDIQEDDPTQKKPGSQFLENQDTSATKAPQSIKIARRNYAESTEDDSKQEELEDETVNTRSQFLENQDTKATKAPQSIKIARRNHDQSIEDDSNQEELKDETVNTRSQFLENQDTKATKAPQSIKIARRNHDQSIEDDFEHEKTDDKVIDGGNGNSDKDSHTRPGPSTTNSQSQVNDPKKETINVGDHAEVEKKEPHDLHENKVETPSKPDENTEPKKE